MMTVSYANGTASFQQQDWLGTERMVTGYTGSVEGTYTSLPFGDGFQVPGSDPDQYHFAGLDYEYKVGTNGGALARFRMYYNTAGRWMSPDLYSGSYDFTNPQSFDRYSYVNGRPLSAIDRMGREGCTPTGNVQGAVADCGLTIVLNALGTSVGWVPVVGWALDIGMAVESLGHFFGWWGHQPPFRGSLKPRPNSPNSGPQQQNACSQPIINAVSSQFGSGTYNVTNTFPQGGATDLQITATDLSASQFNAFQPGRYPLNWWTYVIGYGPTLHVTGTTFSDPNAYYSNSNIGGLTSVDFTAHIDSAFAYNPIGFLIHLFRDMLHLGGPRNPCP